MTLNTKFTKAGVAQRVSNVVFFLHQFLYGAVYISRIKALVVDGSLHQEVVRSVFNAFLIQDDKFCTTLNSNGWNSSQFVDCSLNMHLLLQVGNLKILCKIALEWVSPLMVPPCKARIVWGGNFQVCKGNYFYHDFAINDSTCHEWLLTALFTMCSDIFYIFQEEPWGWIYWAHFCNCCEQVCFSQHVCWLHTTRHKGWDHETIGSCHCNTLYHFCYVIHWNGSGLFWCTTS